MSYNPHIHHRRSIRLKGYDYSQAGAYFVTICCGSMECRFGKIEADEMILNEYGAIAYNEWVKLPERFPNFELDVFQIMPNHMHGIVLLNESVTVVGAGFTPALDPEIPSRYEKISGQNTSDRDQNRATARRATARAAPTVGDIIGAYKSLVTNECLNIYKSKNETMGKLWQRNYHEHIIRTEKSYHTISTYIINNPANWEDDKFYKI